MSPLSALFYDKLMKATEEACLIDWRRALLENLTGKVLEIGAGTGASLELYPQDKGLELYLAEPDKNMRSQLETKVAKSGADNIQVLSCSSESIDSDSDRFDYVFVSLVCCSVQNVAQTLQEINRVLKPAGKFIFLEHVAAKDGTSRRNWQNRLNFLWRKLAGNCHLNRDTEQLIKDSDFIIESIKHESMRKAMPLVRPTIRGVAVLSEQGQGRTDK